MLILYVDECMTIFPRLDMPKIGKVVQRAIGDRESMP